MQLCHTPARPGHPNPGAAHQNTHIYPDPDANPYVNLYVDAYQYIHANRYPNIDVHADAYQYGHAHPHAAPAGNFGRALLLPLG